MNGSFFIPTIYAKSQITTKKPKSLEKSGLFRYYRKRQKKKNCKYRLHFRKYVQVFHDKVVCPTFWDRPPLEAAISSCFRHRRFL